MAAGADQAAITLATATAAGIVAQSLARSLHLPGIVLLLAVGVILGPDAVGLIEPKNLGDALNEVVGFAVAVILFEGGMHLDFKTFRRGQNTIRRLVTAGALITGLGGSLAALLIMGWELRESVLFGCLVIVTGPTVVTPLLRRFKLKRSVSNVLEAEGVLIDAVGAVTAVVALEIAVEPTKENVARGLVGAAARLGLGALAGLIGGFVIWGLLRVKNLIAEGLENVFVLAMVWALFQGTQAIIHESGIAAVTVAGLVLGNLRTRLHRELLEFKDQLVVLLIGMLFVLLAAGVRIAEVVALGTPGLLTVAALVFVVRPLTVGIATMGSSLSWRERLFIAWIAPRGIIAAAVASLFASNLERAGIPGGERLRALVFLVIAITVVLAGLTGGPVAKLLGLSRRPMGWLFLGANAVAREMARRLKENGEEVTMLDLSVDQCAAAQHLGIEVVQGNGLDDDVLEKVRVGMRAGVAALTPNDEINLLFIDKAKSIGRVATRLAALRSATLGATAEMVRDAGGHVLFGDDYDVELWSARLRNGEAEVVAMAAGAAPRLGHDGSGQTLAVPLIHQRGQVITPVSEATLIRQGDRVDFAIDLERRVEAERFLLEHGFTPHGEGPPIVETPPPMKVEPASDPT